MMEAEQGRAMFDKKYAYEHGEEKFLKLKIWFLVRLFATKRNIPGK